MPGMELQAIAPGIQLLPLHAPLPGFERYFGAYLFLGKKKAIIDPGPGVTIPGLLAGLAAAAVPLEDVDYLILTHIHMDHAGGAGTLLKRMTKATVVAHPRARRHLVNPAVLHEASVKTLGQLAIAYGPLDPVPEERILDASDSMRLDLGGLTAELHLTPGHAPHHLAVHEPSSRAVMSGDLAGVCLEGACRPETPPPFRLHETLRSLDRLIALRPELLCYAHLGCYPHAVARLEATKRTLLAWRDTIAAQAGAAPEAILAALRRQDPGLGYLDSIGPDAYAREHAFILRCIEGIATATPDA